MLSRHHIRTVECETADDFDGTRYSGGRLPEHSHGPRADGRMGKRSALLPTVTSLVGFLPKIPLTKSPGAASPAGATRTTTQRSSRERVVANVDVGHHNLRS